MKTQHDSETPAKGQQVITACAFIHEMKDGVEKLFLPKRALTKKFLPGVYEIPGGHIDFGEDILSGLQREIREEFGVEIHIGDPFAAFTYLNPLKGSHSIEVVYFAKLQNSDAKITINPEDHSEYIWISESDLTNYVTPHKCEDDPEWMAMKKGFALLSGKPPTC